MKNKLLVLWMLAYLGLLAIPQPVQAQGDEVSWLLGQINNLRAGLGLPGYALNGALSSAAQRHSEWMAQNGIISHDWTDGTSYNDRARAAGYTGNVTENIYGGSNASASTAFNWWLGSSVHYNSMVSGNYNEIGIGIASGSGMRVYTLVFGRGSNVQAPPPPEPQPAQPQGEQPASAQTNPQPAVQAPRPQPTLAPTRVLPTFTPSPTVPTSTPTITWTPTATWTPSPTTTLPPPTATPLILPTAEEIALLPSPTPLEIEMPPVEVSAATAAPRTVASITVEEESNAFDWRTLLPFLIIGQVILFGWVAWRSFGRRSL